MFDCHLDCNMVRTSSIVGRSMLRSVASPGSRPAPRGEAYHPLGNHRNAWRLSVLCVCTCVHAGVWVCVCVFALS